MKSEYIKSKNDVEGITFPCLMISVETGNIVLFTDYNKGTIVYININLNNNTLYMLGDYSEGWIDCKISDHWMPLKKDEEVILGNN